MDVEILVEEFEVAVEFPFMDRLCCFSGSYSKVRIFFFLTSCVYQFVSNTNHYVLCCEKVNQ